LGIETETASLQANATGAPNNTGTQSSATVSLFAPLLVHPAPHFFVGLGPTLSRDLGRGSNFLSSDDPSTSAGAALTIGGWID
jgi:hypothetical protein